MTWLNANVCGRNFGKSLVIIAGRDDRTIGTSNSQIMLIELVVLLRLCCIIGIPALSWMVVWFILRCKWSDEGNSSRSINKWMNEITHRAVVSLCWSLAPWIQLPSLAPLALLEVNCFGALDGFWPKHRITKTSDLKANKCLAIGCR